MSRFVGTTLLILVCASAALAADPTIEWDVGSPSAATGPRILATGKYTIPAPAGGVSWTLTKIVVEYKPNNDTTWTTANATVDATNKTWSLLSGIQPAGVYNVRIRMEVVKTTNNPAIPPTMENKVIEPVPPTPKNVTL